MVVGICYPDFTLARAFLWSKSVTGLFLKKLAQDEMWGMPSMDAAHDGDPFIEVTGWRREGHMSLLLSKDYPHTHGEH